MFEDLKKIKELVIKYISIINEEYTNSTKIDINDIDRLVTFSQSNTITFSVNNGVLYLPKNAYNVIPLFSTFSNYGSCKSDRRFPDEYLDTNTTYFEYINHVIVSGMSVFDYFLESLLHEVMHMCGSGGCIPLDEGINELKTRELAQKYNITIAAYGYSKEVEIAKRIQNIFGREFMDELTFVPAPYRYIHIKNNLGIEYADLYREISNGMIEKSREFFSNNFSVSDPYEKARLYDLIDYTDLYEKIDSFQKKSYK